MVNLYLDEERWTPEATGSHLNPLDRGATLEALSCLVPLRLLILNMPARCCPWTWRTLRLWCCLVCWAFLLPWACLRQPTVFGAPCQNPPTHWWQAGAKQFSWFRLRWDGSTFFSIVFLAQMMVPAGLSLCLQFVADLTFFPVTWARFTQSSVALAASCMIFSYAVSYKQVIRAEQCFSTAYSLFEPRNFQGWHEWELFSRRYHEIEEYKNDRLMRNREIGCRYIRWNQEAGSQWASCIRTLPAFT